MLLLPTKNTNKTGWSRRGRRGPCPLLPRQQTQRDSGKGQRIPGGRGWHSLAGLAAAQGKASASQGQHKAQGGENELSGWSEFVLTGAEAAAQGKPPVPSSLSGEKLQRSPFLADCTDYFINSVTSHPKKCFNCRLSLSQQPDTPFPPCQAQRNLPSDSSRLAGAQGCPRGLLRALWPGPAPPSPSA